MIQPYLKVNQWLFPIRNSFFIIPADNWGRGGILHSKYVFPLVLCLTVLDIMTMNPSAICLLSWNCIFRCLIWIYHKWSFFLAEGEYEKVRTREEVIKLPNKMQLFEQTFAPGRGREHENLQHPLHPSVPVYFKHTDKESRLALGKEQRVNTNLGGVLPSLEPDRETRLTAN